MLKYNSSSLAFTPTYLLSDHLGSTSLTTNASGGLISEMKYKAWGEVRSSTGTTPTDYTYTGQYSHTADFGLMFYNARWYDPSLGRFAQADSIVPGGVQGLDRYAYVNNNPLRYTDPTGHMCSDPENTKNGFCEGSANVKTKIGNTMVDGNGKTNYGNSSKGKENKDDSAGMPYGPPAQIACYRNRACTNTPNIDLHPYNIINPVIAGRTLVYSENGEVTGYRDITTVPNYQNFTIHPEILNPKFVFGKLVDEATTNLIEKNLLFLGKTGAAATFKKLNTVLLWVDVAKTGNQLITFETQSVKIGPIIPQRTGSPLPDFSISFSEYLAYP